MASAVTSIYNNVISAASAGFAPTNSAVVSAIASAYQVVSATGTQLYAGSSYLTSVNSAPLSAARAGNAANASLANSAWYDGTGRLISSLPDSATVSAIASSYAESAASSKQDALTFGYDTANNISSIDGSAIGGQGGGSGIDSATCSAIASSYAESAVSSYVPYSSLEYNTASAISGINGSALAAGSTYSAGEGIDITDDVISVETPVDIVAGPGIVIDNPDGNTLRVSVAADYEVELLSSPVSTPATTVASTTLTETVKNFEYIAIYGYTDDGAAFPFSVRLAVPQSVSGDITWSCAATNSGYVKFILGKVNGTSLTLSKVKALQWGGGWADPGGTWAVTKVVGIHRIANN